MSTRSRAVLDRRRRDLCRLSPQRALATIEEAELFLVERGMLTLTPDSALPSLFGATHEAPFAPGRSGLAPTRRPSGGGVGLSVLCRASCRRSCTAVRASFCRNAAPTVVDPLCRRELAAAVAGDLGDTARQIVDHLEAAGPSLLEELKEELGLEAKALRSARQKLEARRSDLERQCSADHGGRLAHSLKPANALGSAGAGVAESGGRGARRPRGRRCSGSSHR